MEAQVEKTETSLEVKRIFLAPVSLVYQAWINPEMLNGWFRPTTEMTSICSVDLRVGGRYSIQMKNPKGDFTVAGDYKEIVPEKKLVFSWQWQGEEEYEVTQVTVLFRAISSAETELTLLHEYFVTHEERDSHGEGWLGTFDQLAVSLSQALSPVE
jgi:uncharacterized protein YndB with AHSA1/START domain